MNAFSVVHGFKHVFMFFSPNLYLKRKLLYCVIPFEQVSTIKESTLQ